MKDKLIVFLLLFISINLALASAELGYIDDTQPKLNRDVSQNLIININESLFNVNNSDYLDGYDSSAFAKLAAFNTFLYENDFADKIYVNNIQTRDNKDIAVYDEAINSIVYGDVDYDFNFLLGKRIDLLSDNFNIYDLSGNSYMAYYNNISYFYRNLISQSGSNMTSNYYFGNGSQLTGVCLSNGTNCPVSSGAMNYTNLHLTNKSNKDYGVQAIALDNNYMLNISYENGTTQMPSYTNTGGSGDRTATITLSTTFGTSGNTIKLLNGNTADSDPYFATDANPSGKYMRFDFGAGNQKLITGFKWYQDLGTSHAWMVFQGSNDASTWTNVSSAPFRLGGSTVATVNFPSNTNTYRYYQFIAINNTYGMSNSPYTNEIEFNISSGGTGYRGKLQTYILNGATASGVLSLQENGGNVVIGKNSSLNGYTLDVAGDINSSNVYTDVLYSRQARTILNTTGAVNFNNQNLTNVGLLKVGTTDESVFGTYPKSIFSYYKQSAIPTTNTAGQILQTVATYTNDSTQTIGTLISMASDYNSQNHASLRGLNLQMTHFGTGVVTSTIGGLFILQNVGGGNITDAYAGQFYVQNTAGLITNAYGNMIITPVMSASGRTTNQYGLYVQEQNTTNITNQAYGIYQQSTKDRNAFFGKTGFGNNAPTEAISVTGNISTTGVIKMSSLGSVTLYTCGASQTGDIARNITGTYGCNGASWMRIF